MADKPIAESLQIGEPLRLLDGSEIPFIGAAPLNELESVMELWNTFMQCPSFPWLYTPEFKEQRDAFEKLLYIATGKKISKKELLGRITAGDSEEILTYLSRFCGFVPPKAETTEVAQEDGDSEGQD